MGKTVIRSTPVLVIGTCTAAAVAYTVRWHQTNAHRQGRAPFNLVATPGAQTVPAGHVARYRINIHRGRYRGHIKLSVVGARPKLKSARGQSLGRRVMLSVHRLKGVLTVRTAMSDATGSYRVMLKAVGGRFQGFLTVALKITPPPSASFNIAGNFGPVWPGTAQAVDLALSNPNPQTISVSALQVAVKSVSAPRATNTLPCSVGDFSVRQFAGSYPLGLPAEATVHLSDLGVPPALGPQLVMLNRPVNQDGCQGATVTLSYSGTATSP